MIEFGKQLRKFRHRCNHSQSPHGKLTQEDFGELVGTSLGIHYTGAAVSDWERGKSKIHDRPVLLAVVKVLFEQGGIRTTEEANQLLKAGNYRDLEHEEAEMLFDGVTHAPDVERFTSEQTSPNPSQPSLLEDLFAIPQDEWKEIIIKAQDGPSPSWPRVLAALMRKGSERISITPKSVLWIWVWLLAWWLISPSLRYPFADQDMAFLAIGMYVAGTLIIPLLIGLLINTKNNRYWQQEGLTTSALLRLYTYQGAGIGFNLGYFFLLPFVLIGYYLGFGTSVWLEFAAVTLGLMLGNMSARVVPHNLWRAYARLHLADGAIFFVVALLGPLWGLFFLEFHSVLLTPFLGSMSILLAFTLFVVIAVRQSRKKLTADRQA